jgi:low affinity Fe/Cu permease
MPSPEVLVPAIAEAPKAAVLGSASEQAKPGWRTAFAKLAEWSAEAMGSAIAFVAATAACIVWAVSGPLFEYSDTWQLVINTATTVLTFLAVFLIQNTQNREGRALQLKLDELIRASKDARNRLIDLEHCSEEELHELQAEFKRRKLADNDQGGQTRLRRAGERDDHGA